MPRDKVDLLIKDGEICTSQQRYRGDILVDEGKIVALRDISAFPEADQVINATGKVVIPGVIHTHCHFRDPGYTYKEDFTTGTRAAAAGGVTSTISMTNVRPAPTKSEIFEQWKEDAAGKCIVDFALYGGYGNNSEPSDIAALARAGAIGIKVFNFQDFKATYPHLPELAVTDWGIIHEVFEACAAIKIPVTVHPDLSSWVNKLVIREYINKGRTTIDDYHESAARGITYGHGMVMGASLCAYISRITRAKLLLLHIGMMPEEGYEVLRITKEREGMDNIYGEMECNILFMDQQRADRLGIYSNGWKTPRDRDAGWQAINDGTVDFCVIEHAPHAKEDVELGREDMWKCHTGPLGIQEFLPLMLTAVNEGMLTLEKLVQVTSENSAKFFGIYPKKGTITVGADADFTIIDLGKDDVITTDRILSKCGWTPWDGYQVKGMPVYTVVRGKTVMKDGEVIGQPGDGKFISGMTAQKIA